MAEAPIERSFPGRATARKEISGKLTNAQFGATQYGRSPIRHRGYSGPWEERSGRMASAKTPVYIAAGQVSSTFASRAMKYNALRAFLSAAVICTALPALAAPNYVLPRIDLQTRCKNSEQTMIDMMGDQSLQKTAFDTCMKSEQD